MTVLISRKPVTTLAVATSLALSAITAQSTVANESSPARFSGLEETVVSATRIPATLAETAVAISVLTEEDIQELGYVDALQLIDTQVGVSITQNGGLGSASGVRIRGEEGFRTRILLDGIDIADPSSPQVSPRFEHIMAQGLARIEILRGPQGLLYGADAGGVIAFTTQQPTDGFDARFNADVGSDGFRRYGVSVAGQNDTLGGALSVTDTQTDGFNALTLDPSQDDDGYGNTTVHGTGQWHITDNLLLSGTLHTIDGDNEYDNCFDSATFNTVNDCADDYEQEAGRIALQHTSERGYHQLSYSRSETDRRFFTLGLESFALAGKTEHIDALGSLQIHENSRITYGIDATRSELDDAAGGRERDNIGVYGEWQQRINNTLLTAGIRHDDNDDFGTNTAWRLTALHRLTGQDADWVLRAAAGTGFRAPSLYEIAYNQGPFAFGAASDITLEQEHSAGWEIGLRREASSYFLEMVYFDQRIEDEIFFDLDTFSGYLQNSEEAASRGVEIFGEILLSPNWRLVGNALWNDTETSDGLQRAYRPELSGRLSLFWRSEEWQVGTTIRHSQDSVDTAGLGMDDLTVLDMTMRYALSEKLALTGRVENLTDDDAPRVRNYNTGGRRWFAGVQYAL
jgi:vitamin B12 transporter